MIMKSQRICLVPQLKGIGGMVSFQARLSAGLARRGIQVTYDLENRPYEAVLVIGGTRNLAGLWSARRAGIPIVQRLDGRNWIHRVSSTSVRHYIRAEYGNWLLQLIRSQLASYIVYQSTFSRTWWERDKGQISCPNTVIFNGVDLNVYTPDGSEKPPSDRIRILLVEGNLMGGYELGLRLALQLTASLQPSLSKAVELMVVGRINEDLRFNISKETALQIGWYGQVPREEIPKIDRSAHLLFSGDLNPACPNAVIEALACGLPVVAFDTGALKELVPANAGRLTAYGSDPWILQDPDIPSLANAAEEVLENLNDFRIGARAWAEKQFDLEQMVDRYLDVLLER